MIINKFIIHVLDKNSEFPILNDVENTITPETDAFYQKVIRRILRDDDLRKAKFDSYQDNEIRICADHILNEEPSFVVSSQGIARFLFDSMKINAELESCDLAVVLYTHKDQKGVAIIKLDYKKLYTHDIGYDDDKQAVSIKMVTNDIGIQDSQKIVTDFIKAHKVKDEKFLTKSFRNTTENWITNAYGNNVKEAEGIRSILNHTLKEGNDVSISKFIKESISDPERQESYKELLEEKEINEDFPIDKTWVEKKLKRRSIKTNTGFDIKGLLEDFEDPMKYTITQNPDGTVDIRIKNIEFYEEK